jgi:curli biogenesis system outer membrane secretion channel CsgG
MRIIEPIMVVGLSVVAVGCADLLVWNSAPTSDTGATTQALQKLPRRPGERVPVTLYEFRSEVPEINGRAATDMFTTALIKSGQFSVKERARVNQGVIREKQMNAAGQTTGRSGQVPLREARYIFEGAVTEATGSTKSSKTGFNIGGAQIGGGTNTDTIGVDVRIVEVATGDIVDAINVRKELKSATTSVSGVNTLVTTVRAQKGKETSALMPDVTHESTRKESVDAALRACIESAVAELGRRFE